MLPFVARQAGKPRCVPRYRPATSLSIPARIVLGEPTILPSSRLLASGLHGAGRHEVVFDAADLPSGLYLYRLQAGRFTESTRLVLRR